MLDVRKLAAVELQILGANVILAEFTIGVIRVRAWFYEDSEGFFAGKRNWNWSMDAGVDAKDVASASAMGCFFSHNLHNCGALLRLA